MPIPHTTYMQRCLELATSGAGQTAPNPMVGAVLAYQDHIIGEGYHEQFGKAHAEVNCIKSVQEQEQHLIAASTLYVSLEPCSHFGKTPPCTDLILKHGIKKVVIGCKDSAQHVNGKGIAALREHGVEVVEGICEEEAKNLNRRFFTFHTQNRPYIILKWASSQDGYIGWHNQRTQLSNSITNHEVHRWRSEETAIWVGFNTAFIDNPNLSVRLVHGKNPIRILYDKQLNLPETHQLFNQESRTIIFNSLESKVDNATEFVKINPEHPIQEILQYLYSKQVLSILVEGGAKLHQQLIDAGLWDEIRHIESPLLLHSGVKAVQIPFDAQIFKQYHVLEDQITFYQRTKSA